MGARPSWRLGEMDHGGPFGWDLITRADLDHVVACLKNYETQTWSAIFVGSSYQNHGHDVDDLSLEAQQRLVAIKKDDVDRLHRLRLSNTKRLWGIFRAGTFALLWWDPTHRVRPTPKKNT
jgi:hypothetical protein